MIFGWFILCSVAAISCAVSDRFRRKTGVVFALLAGMCPWLFYWALEHGSRYAATNNFFGISVGLAGVFGSTVFFIVAAVILLVKRRFTEERGLYISASLGVLSGFASTAQIMSILDALGSV